MTISTNGTDINPEPPFVEPNSTDYPDWNNPPASNLIPEAVPDDSGGADPDDSGEAEPDNSGRAPIPRIISLSDTGQLRIGWDSVMNVPDEFEQIPKSKLAIQDWSAFDQEN